MSKYERVREVEMNFLMKNSNIPKRMLRNTDLTPDADDLESFKKLAKIRANMRDFVEDGRNLYIYSENFGNGKTTWAVKLLISYYEQIALGNQFRVRGVFVNVSSLFIEMKNNISYKDADFNQFLEDIRNADLVVWDDIAITDMSDYEVEQLTVIIDGRISQGKSNIYTGNLANNELLKVLGGRLFSRVWKMSRMIEFVGDDRRSYE